MTLLRDWPVIEKALEDLRVRPNLVDYDATRAAFSWEEQRRALAGLPGGGLNIAHEAVDRHAGGPRRDHVALRCLARDGSVDDVTYAALAERTSRAANAYASLGLARGDRVFLLMNRGADLYVAMLGALKLGLVVSPLFSAFGPEPVQQRMAIGKGRAIVTTPTFFQKKVAPVRASLPDLEHVLLVSDPGKALDPAAPLMTEPGVRDFAALVAVASERFVIPPTEPEEMALLHFTSGTTGKPKGAVHVHGAVVHHQASARFALDLQPDDVFWCTADPGWVTGTSYGIIAPLVLGVTLIVDEADFEAERWYRVLREQRVSVWYTAPTAVRMMMRAGAELARRHALPDLRFIASVGEPLNPEAVRWGIDAFGLPIHDNWWQTETGGIMLANFAACPIRPGSMGRPLPGVEVGLVRRKDDGGVEVIDAPDTEGELALRPGWPSMFRGYLSDPDRYAKCFAGGWYLSGDLAQRDRDGYYWFIGRADDVIKTAGHLVGPFEVESVLMEHPAVAEAGVIGTPDPVALEVIKAFVALKPGSTGDEALRRELLGHARKRLGAAIAPREIAFVEGLPKTRSGKVMRRLLKARELGLPEGDLSTLEPEPQGARS